MFFPDREIFLLGLWVLVVFWVGARFGDLKNDPLVYAVISKDMALGGNWLSPALMGEPYLNKPPLFFWIVGGFFKLFGASFYAAKLPSLLFATADVFMLYYIALKWFEDRDTAFFSAFSFLGTRWLVRDFATCRPESLLVFGMLLGLVAFTWMLEGKRRGPYLLGAAFALMAMTKFSFALFLPLAVFLYAATRKKLASWLRWPHLWGGAALGLLIPGAWLLHFESRNPGYFAHMFLGQTVKRAVEGLDVGSDPLMYLKEMAFYYHPWLVFFLIGCVLMWKRRRSEYAWFTLVAAAAIAVVLQFSTGKASRYLIPLTPFLAMISAHGVVRYEKARLFMRGAALYLVFGLLVFFWSVPVVINPPKFRALHLAAELQRGGPLYTDTFAFLHKPAAAQNARPLAEWSPPGAPDEYRMANYFYLPAGRLLWGDADLKDYAENGRGDILLIAPSRFAEALPQGNKILWTKLHADRYHTLFAGAPK